MNKKEKTLVEKIRSRIHTVYLAVGVLVFFILIVFAVLVFAGYGGSDISEEDRASYVEVKLPVVNWDKYNSLSKSQ